MTPRSGKLATTSAELPFFRRLMQAARDPADPVTQAVAGALAITHPQDAGPVDPLPGYSAFRFESLLTEYFPGTALAIRVVRDPACCTALRDAEVEDVLALLLEHAADDEEQTRLAAHATATACLGKNHLWQDMGLVNREALSALLTRFFPSLAAKNTGNMRWKKFFYKQLCDREGLNLCRAPSCNVCVDYAGCFGPETPDVQAWNLRGGSGTNPPDPSSEPYSESGPDKTDEHPD